MHHHKVFHDICQSSGRVQRDDLWNKHRNQLRTQASKTLFYLKKTISKHLFSADIGCAKTLMHLCDSVLDLCNSAAWIQMFWARTGAVHDSVAPVQLEGVIKLLQSFLRLLIATIINPTKRLLQHCRAKIFLRVPPVTIILSIVSLLYLPPTS